ncbi:MULTISPECIES: DUF6504 family protein [Nocardiopsis]|jgi:hypothetical protein|uniref:DUF6504 family protein n=2 Tax=Nocardiopsis alba TaxID=53437 RepID=A0ABV5DV43_9ACTN|nr:MULTISPECIES: DUF6504 family protein [Nocardiopsis]AFR09883.1 putative nucleotidyltransferase protein [Nocardiopsis alba ATCC BAA-2165]MEC3894026.1 DUF6504 family protein [Nocardiopsis sp. LDBS1602]
MPGGVVVGRYYGADVTVVEDEGRPARFVWNGRVYGIRRILDHWVTLSSLRKPGEGSWAPECRHWRVEAGSAYSQGVYELRHDTITREWTLARVWG